MNENVAVAPPFRYCWTHFWSTSWSSNYIYYMSFQILGCQESNALNGARFGVETNKLCLFEDKREKLKREFCSRDTIWKGVSQLRNHPLAHECHFKKPICPFRSYENSPSPQNPPFAVKMLQASKWAAKMFLFFSMGCENVFLFSLPLQDDLQATKWFVKTPCEAKENCENANKAPQPCF